MTCAKLFLGLKGALLNNNFLALFNMTNQDIPQTFQVLVDVLSGTTFAFLPAIVCWSTFRVFGGSPVLGLIPGLMLVNGSLPNAYSVAGPSSGVVPLMLFGFIPIVGYQGSILPAFVAGVLGCKLEKKLRKTVPAVFDFMITPFLVLLIMLVLSLLVIGPLLHALENVLLVIVEAALFGVILRYGLKPFLLSCSINGIAGMTAMLLGMKGTGNGITTIPGMLLYIYSPSQILMYVILAAVVFALAFTLTWLFAVPPEVMEADAPKGGKSSPAPAPAVFPEVLGSVAKGTVVPMAEIPDPTFSQGVLGICCGVTPAEGKVYAPMDGTISQLADTLHALGIEAGGVELLIHVGVDTVDMNGDGFKSHVQVGQAVKKGDLLLQGQREQPVLPANDRRPLQRGCQATAVVFQLQVQGRTNRPPHCA